MADLASAADKFQPSSSGLLLLLLYCWPVPGIFTTTRLEFLLLLALFGLSMNSWGRQNVDTHRGQFQAVPSLYYMHRNSTPHNPTEFHRKWQHTRKFRRTPAKPPPPYTITPRDLRPIPGRTAISQNCRRGPRPSPALRRELTTTIFDRDHDRSDDRKSAFLCAEPTRWSLFRGHNFFSVATFPVFSPFATKCPT